MDKDFEKNRGLDSLEKWDLHDKIDDGLHILEKKTSEHIAHAEHDMDLLWLWIDSEALDELKKQVDETLEKNDILQDKTNRLQEEQRNVTTLHERNNYNRINDSIQKSIKDNSEDDRSIAGRQESYKKIDVFTSSLKKQNNLFGRLVKLLT